MISAGQAPSVDAWLFRSGADGDPDATPPERRSSARPAGCARRTHEFSLDEAPTAHEHFDARDEGRTKVVLHPNAHGNGHKR